MPSPSQNADLSKQVERFLRKIWITKGARFNAHRRIERQKRFSRVTFYLLTLLVVAVSLVGLVFSDSLTPNQSRIIGSTTILLSVFIVFFYQTEDSKEHDMKEFLMLGCGKELSALHSDIEIEYELGDLDSDELASLLSKYNEIIERYQDNHLDIDFHYFMVRNPGRFERYAQNTSNIQKFWTRFVYNFYPVFGLITYMLIPAIVFIFAGYFFFRSNGFP